jgi:DNA topoisomerase-3
MNVGRVQSPTLAMLVNRGKAIDEFTPEAFYVPELNIGAFTASGERLTDKAEAERITEDCQDQPAYCVSVRRQEKSEAPPKLYDLTALQREANRLYGFTAQQTLDYAQSLYEKRLLSYPRTDSRYITGDMRGTAMKLLDGKVDFVPDVDRIIGVVTDHYALLPTFTPYTEDLDSLPNGERQILGLVTARLYCSVAPPYRYEAAEAEINCNGRIFTAKGRSVTDEGWRRFAANRKPDSDDDDSRELPYFESGTVFADVVPGIREGKTTAPPKFTDGTLLKAMQRASAENSAELSEYTEIGTPATRAGIMEKLVKSGVAERVKKQIVPTEKGRRLVSVLPGELTSAALTAKWERKLKQVELGELSDSEFMAGITALTTSLTARYSA